MHVPLTGASIGHAEDAGASVLVLEVLIWGGSGRLMGGGTGGDAGRERGWTQTKGEGAVGVAQGKEGACMGMATGAW